MKQPTPLEKKKNHLSRRALLFLGAQVGFMGMLVYRMRQLGIKETERYLLLADENRINLELIPPTRGLIYDRSGNPAAINVPIYRIQMIREQAKDPKQVLQRLAKIVPISEEQSTKVLENMSRLRPWVPVTVVDNLTWEQVAQVAANSASLPGVKPVVGSYREYMFSHEYSHIIGYVGPVSDYDLSKIEDDDPVLRIPRFQIGKTGVEVGKEKTLRGKAEIKRIEVNSVGRVMGVLDTEAGETGKNLQLTVDVELQKYALNRIKNESAAAVVMDIRNGDLLALASNPTFDPNKFVTGISVADWKDLNENKYRPMVNKTVSGTYPPGSTYKMVVALAALEAGVIGPKERIKCSGHVEVYGRRFHCWSRRGHGNVDLIRALRESCDVYFYDIAQRVGIERISDVARRLGLGIKHDLPLPAVRSGLAPTKEWKRKVKDKSWVIGDTLNAGIGQGFTLSSPMQLAVMTARIASGNSIEPRMLNIIGNTFNPIKGNSPLDFDPEHLALIRRGMYEVVNSGAGTAKRSRIWYDGQEMAGKTGTSQVRFITKKERERGVIRNEDLPWERRDHALFVGYAPYKNPRYAISVIVEHGGGGSKAAAPIAKDIMLEALKRGELKYGVLPSQKRRTDDPDEKPASHPPKISDRA